MDLKPSLWQPSLMLVIGTSLLIFAAATGPSGAAVVEQVLNPSATINVGDTGGRVSANILIPVIPPHLAERPRKGDVLENGDPNCQPGGVDLSSEACSTPLEISAQPQGESAEGTLMGLLGIDLQSTPQNLPTRSLDNADALAANAGTGRGGFANDAAAIVTNQRSTPPPGPRPN